MDDRILYTYYHWGPFLFQTKLTLEECQMLLAEGQKCRNKSNDYRDQLAGHLSEEYRLIYSKKLTSWFQKYIKAYMNGYEKWRGVPQLNPPSSLEVSSMWINYMKSNEFNPPHNHNGDLSFVAYPDVPTEIIKENKLYKGTTIGPGGISWFYGYHLNQQYLDEVRIMPQAGDLFIFPSSLKHWVYPFRSEVERVSVSGNIKFNYKGTL